MWIWSTRQTAICSVMVICLVGCSGAQDPRVVHVFAARNHTAESITVLSATGFTPDVVGLGGQLGPRDPKEDVFSKIENLGPVRVAQAVEIIWIDGGHSKGSQEEKAAERHEQDVSIPDEILAGHKDRGDILGFTFGPDKKWTVKLIPKAERGW